MKKKIFAAVSAFICALVVIVPAVVASVLLKAYATAFYILTGASAGLLFIAIILNLVYASGNLNLGKFDFARLRLEILKEKENWEENYEASYKN
jgi:hypothetical protein